MTNVGSLDRILRFILGAVLLASPFLPPFAAVFAGLGFVKFAVAAVGIVMLVTATIRVCPIYTLLGIRTGPVSRR